MPAELCNVIAPLFDEGYLEIISSNASYVEPISQRSRYAKQAVLFVEIKMKKTLPTNTKIKCLSCGKETDNLICDDCLTEESLDRVISEISSKDPDKRPEIQEYISNFDNQVDG